MAHNMIVVSDLKVGDLITNIGVVDQLNTVGVFTVASVRGTRWSLATGKGDIEHQDVVWHSMDTVVILQEET